jgi:hypothetical protein
MTTPQPPAPAPPPENPFATRAVAAGLWTWAIGATGLLLTRNRVIGPAGLAVFAALTVIAAVVGLFYGLVGVHRGKTLGLGRAPVAMIGVILSVMGLLVSVMALGAVLHAQNQELAEPVMDRSAQFVMLVGSGNIQAAKGLCTADVTETQLTDAFEKIESWGVIRSVEKAYGGQVHDKDHIEVWTLLRFENTAQVLYGHWQRQGDLLFLKSFEFKEAPPAATQPGA